MAAVDIPIAGGQTGDEAHGDPNVNYLKANRGVMSWLWTVDHKRIGLLYLTTVALAFLVGGLFALVMRLELFTAGKTIVDPETYHRFFTLHGAVMVFLFLIPAIPAVLGNFLLPLMVGARGLAFPRLNMLSFYIYVTGAVFCVAAIIMESADTGWTFYTPYSTVTKGCVLALMLSVMVLGLSSILTGINFIVTIHKMRAPGLTWARLPLFGWGMYATAITQILATPVLIITLGLLMFERVLGLGLFDPKLGGDPVLFQHFFWFYAHPAVYITVVSGMAVVSEIIATFSRRAVFGQLAIATSSLALALLAFLVWGSHMFTSGMSEFSTMLFSALTLLVVIPSGVTIFNWIATLYKGEISLRPPMLYALTFIFLFAIGGLSGLFLGTLSTSIHLHGTYFVVAQFHYVVMGGTAMAFIGGLLYWWPKMVGKLYDERKATVGWLLVFIGFNVTFLTQFVLGSRGMPRRSYDYLPQFETLHQVSTIGSWILGLGVFITGFLLIESIASGEAAPPNPWGSASLEWQTATPPVLANFTKAPIVTRGTHDYPLATDGELYDGFPEDRKE